MNDILKDITPLPWETEQEFFGDHQTEISTPGKTGFRGTEIARCNHNWNEAVAGERRISWKEAENNARYIVQACNAYPELVAALEDIARDRGGNMGEYHADCQQIARAALAAAKEATS